MTTKEAKENSCEQKLIRLSLKWKMLLALTIVIVIINASMALIILRKSYVQLDEQHEADRVAKTQELAAAFERALESVATFSYFIPRLSAQPVGRGVDDLESHLAAALDQHGLMLNIEWGVEGVHYFDRDEPVSPSVSWPSGREMPFVDGLQNESLKNDVVASRLICQVQCVQLIALPVLEAGLTAGVLIVERSIGDTLKEYHQLTGLDVAVLDMRRSITGTAMSEMDSRPLAVAGSTRELLVLPVVNELTLESWKADSLQQPERVSVGNEWYEVFTANVVPAEQGIELILIDRVTEQVLAAQSAISDSAVVGGVGVLVSELVLLMFMWGPMRRIQEAVGALPLLADKSFAQLRDGLPTLPADTVPRDEIDRMIVAIGQVSERIEALDEANRLTEADLRQSEARLRQAQTMAHVVSWSGQPLNGNFAFGDGAKRISLVLPHVTKWSEFLAFVHPEDRIPVLKAWRAGRPGSVMDIEFRLLINEQQIDMHAVARFDAVGPMRLLKATGMMQDVSEARAAQRALKDHRDRLEEEVQLRTMELAAERNKANHQAELKSQFLANMSHEIRTPLNAVLGLSQVGMQHSHNRKIAVTFEQILAAGDHLLNVVNDVLDLSKLEAGKLVIASEPFELRPAVAQCLDMFRQRAESKSLQLDVSISHDVPVAVAGDSFRLQQILINLLGNAMKFTENGGVSMDVYQASGMYCFKVTDTGIGMSFEQMQNVSKPYYQSLDNSRLSQQGTGLGLTISYRIATLMGGDIDVKSTLGVGSEFTLRLPLAPAQIADMNALSPAAGTIEDQKKLDGLRVLIADDVSINRTVAEHLLDLEGATVVAVASGSDALDMLAGDMRAEFDVVLMDVQMPDLDGREATRLIRQAGVTVPIIGVTAHASQVERDASLQAGMQDQLVKPLIQESLVDSILSSLNAMGTKAGGEPTLH